MTYETNASGPFTAIKSGRSVTRATLDECAKAYAEMATAENLGLGQIYRTENPEGTRHFINANGAIIE